MGKYGVGGVYCNFVVVIVVCVCACVVVLRWCCGGGEVVLIWRCCVVTICYHGEFHVDGVVWRCVLWWWWWGCIDVMGMGCYHVTVIIACWWCGVEVWMCVLWWWWGCIDIMGMCSGHVAIIMGNGVLVVWCGGVCIYTCKSASVSSIIFDRGITTIRMHTCQWKAWGTFAEMSTSTNMNISILQGAIIFTPTYKNCLNYCYLFCWILYRPFQGTVWSYFKPKFCSVYYMRVDRFVL